MSKKEYVKVPLTYEQQLELLKSRGLEISDNTLALKYLNEISYYRLSAYFLPYQKVKDRFDDGITFNHIIKIIDF